MSVVHCEAKRSANVIKRQQELTNEINLQRKETTKINDEVRQQRKDLTKLTDEGKLQRKEILKLYDDVRLYVNVILRQRRVVSKLSHEWGPQQGEIIKLNDKTRIIYKSTPKWRVCENINTFIDRPQILEHGGSYYSALAQTLCSLEPTSSRFKIKVLKKFNHIVMVLTPIGELYANDPYPGFSDKSTGYESGQIHVNNAYQKVGDEWKNGDIIECGIKFPENFVNDGETEVEVYFSINGRLTVKKVMIMPLHGFFPTVYMENGSGDAARIEFLNFI